MGERSLAPEYYQGRQFERQKDFCKFTASLGYNIKFHLEKEGGRGEKEKEEGREENNQSVILMLTSLLGLWVPRIPHSYHSRNNRTLCTHKQGAFLGKSS